MFDFESKKAKGISNGLIIFKEYFISKASEDFVTKY